jgi:putative transposase
MGKHKKTIKHFNIPGHAHELTFSCFHRYPLLNADRTCQWLAEKTERARLKWNYDVLAYCFMPEHVHLVVLPLDEEYEIETFLQSVKQPVSQEAGNFLRKNDERKWLERLKDGKGSFRFWQKGPGYDRNITEETTLRKMIDYVHLNPVRRGLVERAEDWQWSSARYYATGEQGPITIAKWPFS